MSGMLLKVAESEVDELVRPSLISTGNSKALPF